MFKYQDFKISGLPDSAYYIPNFITEDEEKYLLEKIYASPKPKWKCLCNRRLQNWGGLPHPKGMVQEDLPGWLNEYVRKVSELQMFGEKTPNHVLINEYLPGQGIMPHGDGPLFYPTIATINLGSHTVLDFYRKPDEQDEDQESENNNSDGLKHTSSHIGSLLLDRRSLLIVQDDLYDTYLHGIRELTSDEIEYGVKNMQGSGHSEGDSLQREKRISLTIRHVPKTVKFKFSLR